MVNFGLNAAAILGLFLAVAGAGLFFLRSIRPELARDYDIFFAAVGLLCGIILLFNGWRLDPILQFGQFLLTGTAIFFAFESIRMRSVATEQARRNTPIVDRDRPVSRSRVYTEAEVDRRIDPYDNVYEGAEPNYDSPRLRGYDEPKPRSSRRPSERRRPTPTADLRDEPPRRPSRSRPEPGTAPRSPEANPYGYAEPPREPNNRPRRRPSTPPAASYDSWDDSPRPSRRPSRPRPSVEEPYSEPPTTTRRRPNPADLGRSYEPEDEYRPDNTSSNYEDNLGQDYEADLGRSYEPEDEPSIPGDYVVDYQPVNNSESDYGDNYDDSEDDYDDYQEGADNTPNDDYDDYRDRPETRKPIDFGRDY